MSDWPVGFTGSQAEPTEAQKAALNRVFWQLLDEGFSVLHNGDCVGSDYYAARLWHELGGIVHGHPPIDARKRAFFMFDCREDERPYRERNQAIVDESSKMVATPSGLEKDNPRSGTWMTIRMARRVGKQTIIIWPDGRITEDG